MKDLIEIKNITKSYGTVRVLDNVSLKIKRGEVVGIIGPNGSGKTTLLKIILGLIEASSGIVQYNEENVKSGSMEIRKKMGIVVEDEGAYSQMTVNKYLTFMSNLYGIKKLSDYIMKLIDSIGLTQYLNTRISKLSKGNKQKVAIVRALLHNPEVILLDEATDNLDPEVRNTVIQHIRQLANSGKTIIMCSHNLQEVEFMANQVFILKYGVIVDEIRLDENVYEFNFVIKCESNQNSIDSTVKQLGKKVISAVSTGHGVYIIKCSPENLDDLHKLLTFLLQQDIKIFDLRREQDSLSELYMTAVEGAVSI